MLLTKMFRLCALLTCLVIPVLSQAAQNTLDFIQVLNGNKSEARYYYQHNWAALRKSAVEQDFIQSWQLLETEPSDMAPFDFILITTYATTEQYLHREQNFQKLIAAQGPVKLLNSKKPPEFRTTLFSKDAISE